MRGEDIRGLVTPDKYGISDKEAAKLDKLFEKWPENKIRYAADRLMQFKVANEIEQLINALFKDDEISAAQRQLISDETIILIAGEYNDKYGKENDKARQKALTALIKDRLKDI